MKHLVKKFIVFSLVAPSVSFAINANEIIEVDKASGIKIKNVVSPSSASKYQFKFNLGGIKLAPGEAVYMVMPELDSSQKIDFVALTHNQNPSEENECVKDNPKWDCLPGHTSFEAYDKNQPANKAWRYWNGVGSGKFNSKFAEVRYDGEVDNLYEWIGHGTTSVDDFSTSDEGVTPVVLRVRSVGQDDILAQKVVLKLLPPAPTKMDDFIFSDGFVFGEFDTAYGREYVGDSEMGDYGNALALSSYIASHPKMPKNWKIENGALVVPLRKGMKLSFVDVAGGDMREVPSGGEQENYRGWADLSIRVVRQGNVEQIMSHENVGMNGVMRAISEDETVLSDGDYISIKVEGTPMKVMGIRIGYVE